MGWEPRKDIHTSLTDIANFIKDNSDILSAELPKLRELWRMAWNCNDAPSMKRVIDILNAKSTFTGKWATIEKGWRNKKYSYIVTFTNR